MSGAGAYTVQAVRAVLALCGATVLPRVTQGTAVRRGNSGVLRGEVRHLLGLQCLPEQHPGPRVGFKVVKGEPMVLCTLWGAPIHAPWVSPHDPQDMNTQRMSRATHNRTRLPLGEIHGVKWRCTMTRLGSCCTPLA